MLRTFSALRSSRPTVVVNDGISFNGNGSDLDSETLCPLVRRFIRANVNVPAAIEAQCRSVLDATHPDAFDVNPRSERHGTRASDGDVALGNDPRRRRLNRARRAMRARAPKRNYGHEVCHLICSQRTMQRFLNSRNNQSHP